MIENIRQVIKHVSSQFNTVKRPLKNRQKNILMTNGSLMKVESTAECSPWSILQAFCIFLTCIKR